jgi:hypothetical protein
MFHILFPSEPGSPGKVDLDFAAEHAAAIRAGFGILLYDHHALAKGNPDAATLRIPATSENDAPVMFRGWMVPGETYGELVNRLSAKGYQPQTSCAAYEEAHYLPLAYAHIAQHTARSAWIEGDDCDAAWELYAQFAKTDAILKDWVKSAKHRWKSGCFLPAGTSQERFHEIYRVFREERGHLFNRGVVLREYLPVVEHGFDMRGLPIAEETRLFFWKGQIIVEPLDTHPSPLAERQQWQSIARRFASPFISMDVAYLRDGSFKIIEVGDGGVSGLPSGMSPESFYGNLRGMIEPLGFTPAASV